MRITELLGRTLRDVPADAHGAGYQMLLRGGYVRAAGSGPRGVRDRYAYLPLGKRSLVRLAAALASRANDPITTELELPPLRSIDALALA